MVEIDEPTDVIEGRGACLTTPGVAPACTHRAKDSAAWAYADLALITTLTLLLPGVILLDVALLRVPTGFAAVLVAPGYALLVALFPRRGDIAGVARAAMSIGVSVAVVALLTLALDASPGGIRLWPMVIGLSTWTIGCSGLGAACRYRLHLTEEVVPLPLSVPRMWFRAQSQRRRVGYASGAAIAASLLVAATMLAPTPGETPRLTEFYLLGEGGLAEQYPRVVAPGEPMALHLGVTNREGATQRYRVEIRWRDRSLADTGWFTLESGATWERLMVCSLPEPGSEQQVLLLLSAQDQPEPYRRLHLWLDVRQSATPASTR